jgi:cell cycle serine/threonine-protein kinase CDC5/MSD2
MLSTPLRRFGNSYYEIESFNMGVFPEIYTVRDKSYNVYIIKNYQRDYPSSNILEEAKICSLLSKISPRFFLNYISNSIDEYYVREKYIVIEYSEKGSLNNYILLGNFFEEKLAKILMWKIFHGVKIMHENGVAHRNILLKNIFLDRDYNVKIGGFEFAKMFGIENARNKDCIKLFEEDIFKLGILLVQLISGRLDLNTIKGTIKKSIQKGNFEYFWKIIKSQYIQSEVNISLELIDLVNIMLSHKTSDINILLNHDWFSGFNSLSQCELKEMEMYMIEELKKYERGNHSD